MSFPNNRHGNTPPYLLSAYGIAVKHGYTGTEEEWLASLKGDQGEYPRMQFDSETGYLQIRYDDSGEWTDIASLADLMTESEETVVASAKEYADTAEAYAKGTVDGEAVEEGDTGYEDNSKYYAGQASTYASAAGGFATGASNYAQAASGYATTASGRADAAAASATAAAGSATSAAGSAASASNSAGSASTSASAAEAQATQAGTYAYNADQSAQQAASYAAAANTAYSAVVDVANAVDAKVEDIETQVSIAAGYATNAGTSATNAATSATAASGSATAAAGSATTASGYASAAAASAVTAGENAEAWAVGTRGGQPVPQTDDAYENNSKYYAEQAADVAESIPEDYSELSGDVAELKETVKNSYPIETVSGGVVTFETLVAGVELDNLDVDIDPVQSGTGDPSPENIRPITGFDKCQFIACGKNLFNLADYATAGWTKVEDADYQDHYAGNKNRFYYLRGKPDGTGADPNALGLMPIRKALGRVSFSFHKHNSSNERVYYHYTDAVDWENHSSNISSAGDKKYVSKPNRVCNGVSLYTTQGSSATGSLSQLQVEIGTVKTAYEPFKGTSASVSFGEAGTVYGGHLDVLNGVLTVTHGQIASYAGETLPGAWISSMDVYAEGATPTTGAQVVYELETPVEYQVTPVSVVTQSGINHVFADTGDVEVSYRADFGTLENDIGARTAKTAVSAVETYAQATRAYAVGELLTLDDSLYVVTQPISVDGAIVIGANVRETTISDIIAPRSYTSGIADYYIDEMTDTVAKARNEMTEPSLVLLWTTDNHRWSGNAGGVQNFSNMIENMKAFAAQVPTDAVVCSGDLTDGDKDTDTTLARAYDCMAEFRSIGVPYIWAQGNHDTNYLGGTDQQYLFDLATCFKAYFTDVRPGRVNLAENGTDYYIDYDRLNTRVVVLNANNTANNIEYAFGTSTAAWLSSDALDTDRNVIIISHQLPDHGGAQTTRWSGVKSAMTDFIGGGGNLVMISGHSHLDAAFIDPWVSVTEGCQRFRPNFPEDDTEQSYGMEDYIDVVRVAGRQQYTATEDLWSVCVYKPVSNDFSVIRFGAGKDRYFHVTPIAPATLTTKLTGEITWSSSDEAVATVADGVVTGVGAGRCAILAKDEIGNYECWVVVME